MVDSEPLHVRAWDEALHGYGHKLDDLPEEFLATMAGKKPIVIAEGMVTELTLPLAATDFLAEKTVLFLDIAKTQLKELPGVVSSIRYFSEKGLRLGIGTSIGASNDNDYLATVLKLLDVERYFQVTVTGDQIAHGKPAPDTYLLVAERLGVSPRECLVIEDARSGVESAKAAGCYCIAVKNPSAAEQDTSAADLTLSSLVELTPKLLANLL